MEIKLISRLVRSYVNTSIKPTKLFRQVLGARFYSSSDEEQSTVYNRRGGKSGNFMKYYSNEEAYTFDSQTADMQESGRFNRERKGEYYSFESFLDPRSKKQEINIVLDEIDWSSLCLPAINRDIYVEPEIVKNRSEYEVQNFRDGQNLVLLGHDIPNPILHFSDYQFPEPLQKALDEQGFESPMPIQSQTWPIALNGMDMIGIGQTGSGKTLGFLLPAIVNVLHQTQIKDKGPSSVILAPTRELVQQIATVLTEITKYMDMPVICLYGGVRKRLQIEEILAGGQIYVSTPGRLLDMLEIKIATLENCTYFVLDEADRMLDMGFEPQIRSIASQIRPDRQTLMWSATWPDAIQSLASEFLTEPIQINVGSSELYANPNITQEIVITDPVGKIIALKEVIEQEMRNPDAKILIFVETKKTASLLNMRLQRKNIACSDLHGDHNQISRNRVVSAFRRGIINIVIATDVASRGLDVNNITLVVNYTMPREIETYVHRIGRTARAGKEGKSISFFTNEDKKLAKPLIEILRESEQNVPKELHSMSRHS